MIQRVQSIYLFLAALICSLMFFYSFAAITTPEVTYTLDLFGVHQYMAGRQVSLMGFWTLAIIVSTACATSIVTIFLYKNRKLQITICKLNLLFYLGVIFIIFYSGDKALEFISNLPLESELEYNLSSVFPIISVILVFLASRAIKKDDDLIRSADRIR